MNEIIFTVHTIIIAISALAALALGQSALVAFVCTQCILANLFVIKQITLFGLTATCADAFTVGATIGLNLLQEYFGKETAKKTIWINFFLLIFYAIVSQIHLVYIPHTADIMHLHFMPLLNLMPRIVIASFSVYLISQMADYYLYGLLKKIFHNKYIIFRNYASIATCQFLDTVLFSFVGLYGIIDNVWEVIIISYLVKLASIIIAAPFIGFSRKIYNITTPKIRTDAKKFIIIFIIITISNSSVCMENKKHYEILEFNLKNAVIKNDTNSYSSVPPANQYKILKHCIEHKNMRSLALCLKYEFNPNRYHKQLSLLHYAIQYHNHEAIILLTQYNPDLVPLNDADQTPLDYAVSLRCNACISAMHFAIAKKFNELILFQQHCGLTKHILNPAPCIECQKVLNWQLKWHNLYQPVEFSDLKSTIKFLKQPTPSFHNKEENSHS